MKIMKFFFQDVPEAGEKTFKRFYLPLTISFISAVFAIVLIYLDKFTTDKLYPVENMILVLLLGLPVLGTVFLVAEKFNFSQKIKCLSGFIVLGVLFVYYFFLPEKFFSMDILRYVLFSFASVFTFFSFPVFLKADRYIFRKISLFFLNRALFSVVASYLIFGGLAFAIGAIQILFIPGWNDSYRLIMSIYSACSLIIAPWIFFAGIPEIEKITEVEVSEKFISIISKFIFIPVVLFYLVILYLYFGKVLFFEELPKGMTSYLILSFCSAGILTYFLILEESKNIGKGICRFFEKWFFRSVLPLTFLLWYAIWKRTDDYGITEKRYILITLAVLLTIWTVYFIFSKGKNTLVLFLSTLLAAIIISFGPWGIFETSYRSQKSRLFEILERNQLIENGTIVKAKGEISFADRKNLSSVLIFIEDRWGLKRLGSLIPAESQTSGNRPAERNFVRYNQQNSDSFNLMKWMGIKFVTEWENEKTAESFNFYLNNRDDYTITGPFDALIFASCPKYAQHGKKEPDKPQSFKAEFSNNCRTLTIFENNEKKYEKDLFPVIEKLSKNYDKTNSYNMTVDKLTFSENTDPVNVHIVFTQAYGNFNSSGKVEKLNSVAVFIYFSILKPSNKQIQ